MKPRRENFVTPKDKSEDAAPASSDHQDSAFELDDAQSNFFTNQQQKYEASMADRFKNVPDLKVNENKIQDVLEVLQIPATFAIESDVFLPEDLEDIVFDLQAPFGFEQGQVTTFMERTKVSVKRYVELLRMRNEHVAKLASVVDRLQVDANNLRFQNEISNGINVMPTTDSEDLENQLLEAKLKIKRLEDQIRTIEHGDDLSSEERKTFEDLQDNFSILKRENEDLKEEVYTLKTQVAYYEEEADSGSNSQPASKAPDREEEEKPFDLNAVESFDLPEITEPVVDHGISRKPSASSAFYVDEEDDAAFEASAIELIGDDYRTTNASNMLRDEDEDDDDALDALMREWNQK